MKRHAILLGVVLLGLLSGLSLAQAPVPFVNLPLLPDATAPGGAEYVLTLNGVGFVPNAVVNWNNTALTTQFVNGSQVTATVSAADIATPNTAWVTVVNPSPGGGRSNVVFLPVTIPTSSIGLSRIDATTPFGPETVATGDFNSDGKLDVAVSNYESGKLSILLGIGDGTFQPHSDYPIGRNPSTVVAGDFNGDGNLDLAVFNQGSQSISILMGKGDGTFKAAVNYATGSGGGRMVTADFNRDGKLDLAHTNVGDGTISVLLGNGDGTFQKHVDYATGALPIGIAVGDLNGDGKLDLVAGNANAQTFAVLLGNGDGSFQSYVTYPTINNPQSVVLADFNGDGTLDLAVFGETFGSNGLEILLGNGNGTFQSLVQYPTSCGDGVNDCTAATADLNGDGKLDLAVRNSPADTVQVLLGNGDGTFQNPLSFATGPNPEQVRWATSTGTGGSIW